MTPLIQRGAIQRPPAPRRRGLARRSVAHPKPLFTHPFQTTRSGSRKGAKLSKALQPPDGAKELKTTPAEVLARVCHWAGRCPQRRAGTGGTQRLAELCAGPKPLLGSRAWDEPGERAGFWGWVGAASPFPARWPRGWQLLAPWCVFRRVFFARARGAVQQQRCHHQAHPTPPPAVTHGSDWGFGPVLVGAGVRTGCFGAAAAAETLGAVVSVFKAGRNWRASRRAVREGGAVLEGLGRFLASRLISGMRRVWVLKGVDSGARLGEGREKSPAGGLSNHIWVRPTVEKDFHRRLIQHNLFFSPLFTAFISSISDSCPSLGVALWKGGSAVRYKAPAGLGTQVLIPVSRLQCPGLGGCALHLLLGPAGCFGCNPTRLGVIPALPGISSLPPPPGLGWSAAVGAVVIPISSVPQLLCWHIKG